MENLSAMKEVFDPKGHKEFDDIPKCWILVPVAEWSPFVRKLKKFESCISKVLSLDSRKRVLSFNLKMKLFISYLSWWWQRISKARLRRIITINSPQMKIEIHRVQNEKKAKFFWYVIKNKIDLYWSRPWRRDEEDVVKL